MVQMVSLICVFCKGKKKKLILTGVFWDTWQKQKHYLFGEIYLQLSLLRLPVGSLLNLREKCKLQNTRGNQQGVSSKNEKERG